MITALLRSLLINETQSLKGQMNDPNYCTRTTYRQTASGVGDPSLASARETSRASSRRKQSNTSNADKKTMLRNASESRKLTANYL